MIVVTGGFGFIGSNLIKLLNNNGYENILVVDDLTDGRKILNLSDKKIMDYMDFQDFDVLMNENRCLTENLEQHFFHLGALSATNIWDGKLVMKQNYEYSKKVLNYCNKNKINLTYASSASVYGHTTNPSCETTSELKPLNLYAYSKALFDQYVSRKIDSLDVNVTGLRYFNVYGPGEQHKTGMTSPIYLFYKQLVEDQKCRVFGDGAGFKKGMHSRDFIYVDDACKITKFFMENPISGMFNVGSGKSTTFLDVARSVVEASGLDPACSINFIKFPESLTKFYQPYTCADITKLRQHGYEEKTLNITEGIMKYTEWLTSQFKC